MSSAARLIPTLPQYILRSALTVHTTDIFTNYFLLVPVFIHIDKVTSQFSDLWCLSRPIGLQGWLLSSLLNTPFSLVIVVVEEPARHYCGVECGHAEVNMFLGSN